MVAAIVATQKTMTNTKQMPLVGLDSHQGQRGTENDDHAAWFAVARPDRQQMIYVGIVADGVTSTAGGAQASRIAAKAIEAALRDLPDPQETLAEWLASAVHNANAEILFEGKQHPEWQGMSTTVVLAALAGHRLYVLHLGDSRAYLQRNGKLHQLTTDHTWAQAAVTSGILSAAEALHHPGRNQLQRYLGSSRQINVARAVLAPESGYAEEYIEVMPGERVLLCSDGVYHRLDQPTLENTLNQMSSPQQAVDALIQAAIDQGEIDDITALVFTVPSTFEEPLHFDASDATDSDQDATVPVDQPLSPPDANRSITRRLAAALGISSS